MALSIIGAILLLALCILLHEIGHFVSAIALGIPVEEFSIGFGPKLVQFKARGIKYSLRLVLLGGYVRYFMDESDLLTVDRRARYDDELDEPDAANADQTDAPLSPANASKADASLSPADADQADTSLSPADAEALRARCYLNQPAWKRFISAFCGPFMNFVLAFVVAVVLFAMQGNPMDAPRIAEYTTDSPAYQAGMQPGDIIVAVDGQPVSYDLNGAQQVLDAIAASEGQPMEFTVQRNGEQLTLTVTPLYSEENGRYMIGASFGKVYSPCTVGEALSRAGQYIVMITRDMYSALGEMFHSEVPLDQQLTGPVGTVQIISEQVRMGAQYGLNVLLVISLNFGILNLLPIPGLDGAKLVVLLIEMVRRKPIPPAREAIVNLVGLALLFGLMLFVTYKDIARLITG
ncbi:MAG TPA: site-2 protease family protein [Candidatus Fimadaptatus faecigallinarum]|uniref:Site-2 protease family protein n=1 Tax=Candidatus Fimadaptatus faecigallinarum TaxID=2840814 RepID=A0A9D1S576_9FIRM|nr:site-2 protease family protein [Candidatus Fimadaptatus faecigallinarum]